MVNRRAAVFRLQVSLLAVSVLVAPLGVCAETPMPEGMVGWWYYTGVNPPIDSPQPPHCMHTHGPEPFQGAFAGNAHHVRSQRTHHGVQIQQRHVYRHPVVCPGGVILQARIFTTLAWGVRQTL